MPTNDDFDPADSLPQFLSVPTEQDIGKAPDGAVAASRVVKASVMIAAATATGIAVLMAGDPVALLAQVSASLVGNSSPPSAPAIQSAADAPALVPSAAEAQALAPTTVDAPTRNEIPASEPAGKDQAENSEPPSETLLRQFQAWAAEQDAQAHGGPVQPVQDAPAQVVQNATAQTAPASATENVRAYRPVQKRRQVRAVNNARAEVRTQNQNPRKQVRRPQSARAERPPVQDARAQDQSVQDAQTPSFPAIFGQRN